MRMAALLLTGRGVALILGLVCLALAAFLDRELGGAPPEIAAAPAAPAPSPVLSKPEAARLPPLSVYGEVLRRPLFSETRRTPPEAASGLADSAEGFVLRGVVIDGDGKFALIEHGRPAALARLGEGQSIDGWTLRSIEPDRVLLADGTVQRELKLRDRPSAARRPALPPAGRRN
jgi:general secretion pathway protein N